MKRLLLTLLAAIALPTAVYANWFGDKTLYLICKISESKSIINGGDYFGGWREINNKNDYGLFKLNEENKTASLSSFMKEDNIISSGLDVELFNEASIKLSRKYKERGEDNFSSIIYYEINRINGYFRVKYDDIDPSDTYGLYRGSCRKSDRKLF